MSKGLISSIIFGLAVVLLFILVAPKYDEIKLAKATITERENLLADYESANQKFSELDMKYNQNKASIDKLSVLLPKSEQTDQIIFSVHEAAAQSGTQLTNISISSQNDQSEGPYEQRTVLVDLYCNYGSLISFLDNIEKNLRLSDVAQIRVSKGSGAGDGALSMSASLTIVVYNLK
ncbi:MAG: hypothetical protein CEN90_256 [Parcubacteria group bacterium Licking1014_17]|nr:MAG: hypothetical protein CEN90_256 [Parcubacteria group bacterium Licking1014_17]